MKSPNSSVFLLLIGVFVSAFPSFGQIPDKQKPLVKFTGSSKQRTSNETFTVRGITKDKGTINLVQLQLNGGSWQTVTTTNGWTNWTAEVTLNPGVNTLLVYGVDVAGNVSRTNKATVLFVKQFKLRDYFITPLGANWLYSGTDWDGESVKISQEVTSTSFVITNYFGSSSPVGYETNCVQLSKAYRDPGTLSVRDSWEEFLVTGEQFGLFGDDDLPDESLRVAGGLVFPEKMAIGAKATARSAAYMFGDYVGKLRVTLAVLDNGSLTVPAGTFPDVLHVRFTILVPGHPQVHDEWWAKSVGLIKRQGISGGGSAQAYELISYSLP